MQLGDVTPSSHLAGRPRELADNMDFQAMRPTSQVGAAPAGTPAKSEAPTPDIKPAHAVSGVSAHALHACLLA